MKVLLGGHVVAWALFSTRCDFKVFRVSESLWTLEIPHKKNREHPILHKQTGPEASDNASKYQHVIILTSQSAKSHKKTSRSDQDNCLDKAPVAAPVPALFHFYSINNIQSSLIWAYFKKYNQHRRFCKWKKKNNKFKSTGKQRFGSNCGLSPQKHQTNNLSSLRHESRTSCNKNW